MTPSVCDVIYECSPRALFRVTILKRHFNVELILGLVVFPLTYLVAKKPVFKQYLYSKLNLEWNYRYSQYSRDLNAELVRYSNGQIEVGWQLDQYLNTG